MKTEFWNESLSEFSDLILNNFVKAKLSLLIRTLLPQDEGEDVKDECEIEEGVQDSDNRKCFKAGEYV